MSQSTYERRKDGTERAGVQINVNLASLGPYYLSKLTNISTGGAFIQHPEPKAVGTVLDITFVLPNDTQPIEAKAEVAWKYIQGGKSVPNGTGMGIKFTEISQENKERISQYINNILNPDTDTAEILPVGSPQP